jgi:DNA-binding NarL/FixJ family response regulator
MTLSEKTIRVGLVEDSSEICEELEHMIRDAAGFELVASCRNATTALRRMPLAEPDVVIMDVQLPDGCGTDCIAQLKRIMPRTQFMVLTVHDDADQIFKALQAGACGYLLKRTAPDALLNALREVRAGGAPMTGEVARKVIESFHRGDSAAPSAAAASSPQEQLTPREEEVIELLAEGYPAKEIAQRLGISADTVNAHLKRIYAKLHVHSRVEAVIRYLK